MTNDLVSIIIETRRYLYEENRNCMVSAAFDTLEKRQINFKQQDLAKKLDLSLSTVNHALKNLRQMGAVKNRRQGGEVVDF